jgi:hypothetical protein
MFIIFYFLFIKYYALFLCAFIDIPIHLYIYLFFYSCGGIQLHIYLFINSLIPSLFLSVFLFVGLEMKLCAEEWSPNPYDSPGFLMLFGEVEVHQLFWQVWDLQGNPTPLLNRKRSRAAGRKKTPAS